MRKAPDPYEVIDADPSEILEIPIIVFYVSLRKEGSHQRVSLPIHPSKFSRLIHVELEAKLHDPFHLAELIVICPGREGK